MGKMNVLLIALPIVAILAVALAIVALVVAIRRFYA
jgi:hypothetical protein